MIWANLSTPSPNAHFSYSLGGLHISTLYFRLFPPDFLITGVFLDKICSLWTDGEAFLPCLISLSGVGLGGALFGSRGFEWGHIIWYNTFTWGFTSSPSTEICPMPNFCVGETA